MHQPHQRVQFFHSQSSFGSQSNASQSRYYDFTKELINQTDNIFLILKKQLKPVQNQSRQDKIDYAMRRALILHKNTIPQHLGYLNKIDAPTNAKDQVNNCFERLSKLLIDNDKIKNGTMIYQQFYNIYSRQGQQKISNFSRNKDPISSQINTSALIKPEYVEISNVKQSAKLKAATPRVFIAENRSIDQKQLISLKEEIHKLKNIIEENKKRYQVQILNLKITFEKRMKVYLNSILLRGQAQEILKNQIEQYHQKISKQYEQHSRLEQVIKQLKKQIFNLKSENILLRQQIQLGRRMQNNVQYNYQSDKKNKMEIELKNIRQQNILLKTQIKIERERYYQIQNNLSEQQRRQLQRNRKQLEKKKIQIQQLYSNLDKQRVQIIQLTYNYKSALRNIEMLKNETEQLKSKIVKASSASQFIPATVLSFSQGGQSNKRCNEKIIILEYDGMGIQGYPYYQTLSKQFKIRFKRGCLKQKQLLYKSNGIEIGSITKRKSIDQIYILLHLTNYSQIKFQKVKGKIMNSNQNQITGDIFQYLTLDSNQQIKIPITFHIHQYPIGPLVLLLQYTTAQKKQQIRILLPAHLLKTITFDNCEEQFDESVGQKMQFKNERKIFKDLNELKIYFNNCKVDDNKIKLLLVQQHTNTKIGICISQDKQVFELRYIHKEGSKQITKYLIKTLLFILSKQTNK